MAGCTEISLSACGVHVHFCGIVLLQQSTPADAEAVVYFSVAVLLCSTEILLSDCDVHFCGSVIVFDGNSAVGL